MVVLVSDLAQRVHPGGGVGWGEIIYPEGPLEGRRGLLPPAGHRSPAAPGHITAQSCEARCFVCLFVFISIVQGCQVTVLPAKGKENFVTAELGIKGDAREVGEVGRSRKKANEFSACRSSLSSPT